MSTVEVRCDRCVYWEEDKDGVGLCHFATTYGDPPKSRKFYAADYTGQFAGVYTAPDFYCAEFNGDIAA